MASLPVSISPAFAIETNLLRLHFHLLDVEMASVSRETGRVDIKLPRAVWGGRLTLVQSEWLRAVVAEELRLQARELLPPRLKAYAAAYHLRPTGMTIKNMSSRWGSCSAKRHINLSLWLLLFDSELVDYVIKHELCHLCEMNHGPRFWALLDEMTQGRARELQRLLRRRVIELCRPAAH